MDLDFANAARPFCSVPRNPPEKGGYLSTLHAHAQLPPRLSDPETQDLYLSSRRCHPTRGVTIALGESKAFSSTRCACLNFLLLTLRTYSAGSRAIHVPCQRRAYTIRIGWCSFVYDGAYQRPGIPCYQCRSEQHTSLTSLDFLALFNHSEMKFSSAGSPVIGWLSAFMASSLVRYVRHRDRHPHSDH